MICVHDPETAVSSRRIDEVIEALRDSGAQSVLVGVVGPGSTELRRSSSAGATVLLLGVADDASLVEAAAAVFPVSGRCVMVVRRSPEGWSFVVAGPEGVSERGLGTVREPGPIREPYVVREEDPDTLGRIGDGVLGGFGTLTGEVLGAVTLGAAGLFIGAAFPCNKVDFHCHNASRGMVVGGGIGAAVGGIAGAGSSAMLVDRDPKRALVASTGLVVAGGAIAAVAELASPGDAASLPGLALMILGLPVAGGIGVGLGEQGAPGRRCGCCRRSVRRASA